MPPKILIVDDDRNICELLRLYLSHEGYDLVFASNGSEAMDRFGEESPDLIILDIMLPLITGWEVCKMIRTRSNVPILMVTAKDTTDDKVGGLEMGADDYVVKPFDPKEVTARVKALLRRFAETTLAAGQQEGGPDHQEIIRLGNLELNLTGYTVFCAGKKAELKPKEIQLLAFLMHNPNIVFTRDQLLERVWGYDYTGETRTVDAHIKRLRASLETDRSGWRIATVWGIGYKFEVD